MGGRSDPSIIATGWPGQFAYVTLAESINSFNGNDGPAWGPDNPIDVVVAVSNDGGQTFGPAANSPPSRPGTFAVISDLQSSGLDTSGGTVDRRHAWHAGHHHLPCRVALRSIPKRDA